MVEREGRFTTMLIYSTDSIFAHPRPTSRKATPHIAKVDELTALCDHFRASLATCEDTHRLLLEALLVEALDPTAKVLEASG
jgi:type I restriction enzyme S subunit